MIDDDEQTQPPSVVAQEATTTNISALLSAYAQKCEENEALITILKEQVEALAVAENALSAIAHSKRANNGTLPLARVIMTAINALREVERILGMQPATPLIQ